MAFRKSGSKEKFDPRSLTAEKWWKTILSFCGLLFFQGRTVKLPGNTTPTKKQQKELRKIMLGSWKCCYFCFGTWQHFGFFPRC